jgi:hypothetical protein
MKNSFKKLTGGVAFAFGMGCGVTALCNGSAQNQPILKANRNDQYEKIGRFVKI